VITGVRFRAVPVHAADDYRLTGESLRKTIEELRAKGLEPFYLTVTLGTTDTCSIDDFDSIADVLAELAPPTQDPATTTAAATNGVDGTTVNGHAETTNGGSGSSSGGDHRGEIWVHVDAAYAGAALVCPEHQHLAAAFGRFHSVNTNLHKWLLTNFDCSALWVRRRGWLVDALAVTLAIVRNDYSDAGLVTDYRDWQIPFGRRFRALKVWFVLRSYGVRGLQDHIRRHVALGDMFAALVRGRPDLFDMVAGPRFALTVFRLKGKGKGTGPASADDDDDKEPTLEDQNAVTKQMHDLVNAEGKIFLSSTVVGGVFAIRHCPASRLVEETHVRKHFDILVEAAEKVLA
jgi:aromatic-L-amino-acid/L-tryptophan decarboxylase